MRNIIVAFSVGIGLATSMIAGEEDLRTGGPWILTLIVFPACALICLGLLLRDHRRRASADDRRPPSESRDGQRNSTPWARGSSPE